nr:hypothetical protein [Streptomyces albus]
MNILDTDATRKPVSDVFGTDHRRDAIPNDLVKTGCPCLVTRTVPENPSSSATPDTTFSRHSGSNLSVVAAVTAHTSQKERS